MYYTYMIRCKDNSIYTGITTNIERRFKEHLNKNEKCAKYTKIHSVIKIEAVCKSETRTLASKLEFQIKKLEKKKKEELLKTKDLTKFFQEKLECEKYKEGGILTCLS